MKFYITTPLYYVNAEPHIGHTYTTVAADCLARFYRMKGYDVFFLTGTDEHGQKIYEASRKENLTPIELADRVSEIFKNMWRKINISFDRFIRTTEKQHEDVVKKVFKTLLEKGELYKGEYKGFYCIYCESYVNVEDKTKPICPDCKREVSEISETSYFFKLSKYQKILENLVENTEFVKPDFRKNEVLNFIKMGLSDLSVTRKNVVWGIESPTDEKYTIYVWFDALLNYLSGIGYLYDQETFKKYWPPDIQLIGKDIMRFHHIIWPAILLSLNLPLPNKIFAHGWWVSGKEKISKSKGNIISPEYYINEYGTDPFRFFLLREIPFGLDGEFSEENFKKRYNSDLVNDFGNLLNRTLNLIEKKFDNYVPEGELDEKIVEFSEDVYKKYTKKIEQVSFSEAIEEIWNLVIFLNKYLDEKSPWRENTDSERTIISVFYGIRNLLIFLYPFIPQTCEKMINMLGLKIEEIKKLENFKIKYPGRIKIGKREIIFHRKK
ncbi:MAG: methionine--tRNA ligase [Candidatus Omnitrophica bacterium]|nr:methionine--tRNA ligase [Candidatus Omnitrophota bacterium]MCM8833038.1 methionine--tRNA ligase [Candidatus Omnitrophota bacterium]